MPIELRCVQCHLRLKVPDELLGKTVECPKCRTEFKAQAPPEEDDDDAQTGPDSDSRSRRWPEQDDDEDEDRFRESAKKRRRRARRAAAKRNLQVPAWFLLTAGVGNGIVMTLWFTFNLLLNLGVLRSLGMQPPPEAGMPGYTAGAVIGFLFFTFITLVWSGLVIAGAVGMLRLRNYPLALTGCIVAMLPCGCGCCLGLPIGIWGLVALQNDDAKRAFGA
jgi:hypothetical protein